MCGIVGRIARPGTPPIADPNRVLASIRHRGPDMLGQFKSEQVWLGHARLSIIDVSSAAQQPMVSKDGRFVISYNGEVYNFKDLIDSNDIRDLRSTSDTEVVLHMLARHGIDSVSLFNGMFAFALYDKEANKLWLVRDRMGIKPLYYRLTANTFAFASEIKGILAVDECPAKCELASINEWLYYGNTLGEKTLYQDVFRLLPGHVLEFDIGSFTPTVNPYWSPQQYSGGNKFSGSATEIVSQTSSYLEQAVARQLVSDVPVGVFLSGGIDSSAITAFASRHYNGKLTTYSAGFDFDKGVNELPAAREIARLYGTDHHELRIAGIEIADTVEKMVKHHDMPFSDAANIPLYLLSSRIRNTTKVVLQGDGGDELFGGYSRYTTLSYYRVARLAARIAKIGLHFMPHDTRYYRSQRYIHALEAPNSAMLMALLLTEQDRYEHLTAIFTRQFQSQIEKSDPFCQYRICQQSVKQEDLLNQMMMVDSMIILPDIFLEKVDRATMAASVETRVPFLDNNLVDFCLRLPGKQKVYLGRKKWLLKRALKGIVPDSVLFGQKTGFGVPYGYWLRTALKPLFMDHLTSFKKSYPDVLNESLIEGLFNEHELGRRNRSCILWKILNFLIWANMSKLEIEC